MIRLKEFKIGDLVGFQPLFGTTYNKYGKIPNDFILGIIIKKRYTNTGCLLFEVKKENGGLSWYKPAELKRY